MRKVSFCHWTLPILLLLTGCATATPVPPTSTSAPTQVPTETFTPTSTPTATPTATATPLPDPITQCVDSTEVFPAETIAGEFVLGGDYYLYLPKLVSYESPSFIFAPATGTKISLPQASGEEILHFVVSPDKKRLAYSTYYTNNGKPHFRLIVLENDGSIRKQYWDPIWNLVGWADDNHLLLGQKGDQEPDPAIVLNPFSGEQETIPFNYPNANPKMNPSIGWNSYRSIEAVYSPDLSLVVYHGEAADYSATGYGSIILWDRATGKTLNHIVDPALLSDAPLWLSNGKQFLVNVTINGIDSGIMELFRLSVDGDVERLTHLADLYGRVEVRGYSISADERYIAFWFHRGDFIYHLAVLDLQTKTVEGICVNSTHDPYAPIWSPDGHQLLVAGYMDIVDNFGTIFVDIDKGILSQVEKGAIPVGWMASP